MPEVVNTTVVRTLADELGWDTLNLAEMLEWLRKSGVNPGGVVAFMRAVAAHPDGVDVTTIPGIAAGELPYIKEWLQKRGMVF